MFASRGIESGASFVKNQRSWLGHQSAADEDALALCFRSNGPRTPREVPALNLFQDSQSLAAVCLAKSAPVVDHRVFAAGDRLNGRFALGHHLTQRGTHQANAFTQFTPVAFAITLAEQGNFSLR